MRDGKLRSCKVRSDKGVVEGRGRRDKASSVESGK